MGKSKNSVSGKTIAVMTSGGDAPGMNACLRGCVRTALEANCRVFAIYEGYQGLISGNISELHWDDVANIIQLGGTVIGTARSTEFRDFPPGMMSRGYCGFKRRNSSKGIFKFSAICFRC